MMGLKGWGRPAERNSFSGPADAHAGAADRELQLLGGPAIADDFSRRQRVVEA